MQAKGSDRCLSLDRLVSSCLIPPWHIHGQKMAENHMKAKAIHTSLLHFENATFLRSNMLVGGSMPLKSRQNNRGYFYTWYKPLRQALCNREGIG